MENIWARDPLSWNSRIPGSYEIDKIEKFTNPSTRTGAYSDKLQPLKKAFKDKGKNGIKFGQGVQVAS